MRGVHVLVQANTQTHRIHKHIAILIRCIIIHLRISFNSVKCFVAPVVWDTVFWQQKTHNLGDSNKNRSIFNFFVEVFLPWRPFYYYYYYQIKKKYYFLISIFHKLSNNTFNDSNGLCTDPLNKIPLNKFR